jgi:hypothetical protein
VVGLLVLVALASHGGRPGADGVAPRALPEGVQDYLVTLLVVSYVLVVVVVLIVLFARRPWRAPDDQWRWLRSMVSAGIAMLVLTAAGYWLLHHRPGAGGAQTTQTVSGQPVLAPRAAPASEADRGARPAEFRWPLALGVAGLVALGAAALFLQARRGARERTDEPTLAEELAQVVETTIEDLRAEPEARKAVIAAYAKMERALSEHGLSRNRSQTQLEYLARILKELEVDPLAVRKLTELFGYAKFSRHDIDEEMRADAIDALTTVQRDLRVGDQVAA